LKFFFEVSAFLFIEAPVAVFPSVDLGGGRSKRHAPFREHCRRFLQFGFPVLAILPSLPVLFHFIVDPR